MRERLTGQRSKYRQSRYFETRVATSCVRRSRGLCSCVADHEHLDWAIGAIAALGMLIAIGLWWLYFDFVSQRHPTPGRTLAWIYLHLPTTMGIAASGAATLNVIENGVEPLPQEVRCLLVVTIALTWISIALLMKTLNLLDEHRRLYRTGEILTLVAAVVILGLGFTSVSTIPLLVLLNLLMLAPVFWGLRVWIDVFGAAEIKLS